MDLDALLGLLFFVVFVVVPMISGARRRGRGQQQPGQSGPAAPGGQGPNQPGRAGSSGAPQGQGAPAQASSAPRTGDHPASSALEEIRRRVQEAQERERRREEERARSRQGGRPSADAQPRRQRGLVTSDPFEGGLVSGSGKSISGQPLGPEGATSQWPPPASAQRTGSLPPTILGREGQAPAGTAGPRPGPLGREGQVTQPAPDLQRSSRRGSLGREGARGLGSMPASARSALGREGRPSRPSAKISAEIGSVDARRAESPYGARLGAASLVNVDREGIVKGLIWHEILKEAPGKRLLRRTRSRPR